MSKGIGGHHQAFRGKTGNWITPPEIIDAIGPFDLDPCAHAEQKVKTAKLMFCHCDDWDGLRQPWHGRVWLNPPYGPQTGQWLERLAAHGKGTALIFARTETDAWQKHVWPKADAVMFLYGRLHFYFPDGARAKHNAGGPSALVAYGWGDELTLEMSQLRGKFIKLK